MLSRVPLRTRSKGGHEQHANPTVRYALIIEVGLAYIFRQMTAFPSGSLLSLDPFDQCYERRRSRAYLTWRIDH